MSASAAPVISVIIVNYNAGERLARCLRSLAPALAGLDWQAIVIDNASQDRSEREALAHGPRVKLIRSATNRGFGAAVNQAAAAADGSAARAGLLLLLNPDAELAPGVVASLIDELNDFPDCAIIGPEIVNEDGTRQGNARGAPTVLTGLFGRATRLRRWLPNSALARRNVVGPELADGARSKPVDWLSGACMLIRREAFDRCGGFDPDFFLYWEDADLCYRLREMGYTIRYAPRMQVRHAVGQSSRTARRLAIRAFHASAFRYYRKHLARGPLDTGLARAILAARRTWLVWRARSA